MARGTKLKQQQEWYRTFATDRLGALVLHGDGELMETQERVGGSSRENSDDQRSQERREI